MISVWKNGPFERIPFASTYSSASRVNSSKPLVMSVSLVPRRRFVSAVPPRLIDPSLTAAEVGGRLHTKRLPKTQSCLGHRSRNCRCRRVVAEAGVDLEDPVAAGLERLAVATDVGVGDAAGLGRPDHLQLG